MPLSCCIITHNETDRIERCILAVRNVVDEIIVVDSGSSDDTVEKAQRLGAKVVFHAWDGYGPQKRFAEDCAMHHWILNLDADEVVTEELAREIAAVMRTPSALKPAYRFRQVTVYPGHDRPRLWADFHKLFNGMRDGILDRTYLGGLEGDMKTNVGVYFCGMSLPSLPVPHILT